MSHEGPQYVIIKSLIDTKLSSCTELKLLGEAGSEGFSWIDGLEKLHFVKVSSVEPEITVVFPVSDCIVVFRANNIEGTCNIVRTPCGPHHKWCEATFSYKKSDLIWQPGEHVRAKLQFYTEQKAQSANLAA